MISRGTNPAKFRREEQHHERHRKLCYNHSHREYPPFEDNPYKVQDNEKMQFLCARAFGRMGFCRHCLFGKSVQQRNMRLFPATAGCTQHHKLGLTDSRQSRPATAAAIALVDSNLHQEHILPSEKAFAHKLKMEALSHQGAACGQAGHKSRNAVSDTDSGSVMFWNSAKSRLFPILLAGGSSARTERSGNRRLCDQACEHYRKFQRRREQER